MSTFGTPWFIFLGRFQFKNHLKKQLKLKIYYRRTIMAQFLAALIHDTSNYPLDVLKAVPYEGWCIEVQRFIGKRGHSQKTSHV